jgi:uncharacterized protein
VDRFVTLSAGECLEVLRGQRVARVAVTHRALPAIFSVIYVMDGEVPVFRTPRDGVLEKACVGAVVALGVDDSPTDSTNGASVLVVGVGTPITDRARLRELGFNPRDDDRGLRGAFVAIPSGVMTGQREAQPRLPPTVNG